MSTVDRPLRADAERNRERLLEAARELFTERGLQSRSTTSPSAPGSASPPSTGASPRAASSIDAVFADQVDAIVASAEEALAIDDPWAAFEYLVTDMAERSARDRGLKEMVLGSPEGRAHVARVREEMRPRVEEIVAAPRPPGGCGTDFAASDLMMVQMMVGAVADVGGEELWRRCLTLLLDGLRAPGASPLPGTPLDFEDLDEVMCKWRPPRR